jgi:hypothetical protein
VLLAALLVTPALAGAAAPGGTKLGASGSGTLWAYGVEKNMSLSVEVNHTTYAVTGWLAYHVILTQTNTSSSLFMLEANRTIGFAYSAVYCEPTCGSGAKVSINITVSAWEHDTGFANFTRTGTVYEGGMSTPALGLVNSSVETASNLTESVQYSVHTLLRTGSGWQALYVALASHATVTFSPPLGLIPLNVTAGAAWNSSSAYHLEGAGSGAVSYNRFASNGTLHHTSFSWSPSITNSGVVDLEGRDLGNLTLASGQTTPVLTLAVTGPFEPREGIIWVPASADLFGAGRSAFQSQSTDSVGVSTSMVDWSPDLRGHAGLLASATGFNPSPDASDAVGQSPSTLTSAGTFGVGPAVGEQVGSSVQAQPETVPQAQAGDQCILSSSCASTSPPNSVGGPLHRFGGLILIGAIVVVAVLVAAVVVSRRAPPKLPASSRPTYPASATPAPSMPPSAGTGGVPSRPAEEDSLAHLW